MIFYQIIDHNKEHFTDYISGFTRDEQLYFFENADTYSDKSALRAHQAGRLLIIYLFRMMYNKTIRYADLQVNKYGKPFFTSGPSFSISHSGTYTLAAISNKTAIGTDIEYSRQTEIKDFEEYMNEDMIQKIKSSKNPLSEFFIFWTKYEALAKADGRGLNLTKKSFEINTDRALIMDKNTHWKYFFPEVPVKYYAAICYSHSESGIQDADIFKRS